MSRNFNVPKGLPEYLQFFAREAIRAQPECIVRFNRIFLEEIEKNTDGDDINTIIDNPDVYQKFQDKILQQVKLDNAQIGGNVEDESDEDKVTEAATKIQANVRGFLARKAAGRRQNSLQF